MIRRTDSSAHIDLDDPNAVARLLEALRRAGAEEQVSALLARDPATYATLDNSANVEMLLRALWEARAYAQITALAERLPARGNFDLFINFGGNRQQFRFGREPDGSAAASWTWNDLD